MKQRTIRREVTISGKGLHTGEDVNVTFCPAEVGTGIVFRRKDLYGKPEIKCNIDFVTDLVRGTTIQSGHTKVHTVEHVLSALQGMQIDNVVVEMDASEPPIMDGSSKHFVNALQQAEPIEQAANRDYFALEEPVCVTEGSRSIIALPYDGLKITCTSADDRGLYTQHLSLEIDPEIYISDIAPARTFTFYEDIEKLLKMGKIRGGSLDCAIVIKGDKILSKEPLRFKDEMVRHKILDIIGDVALLGMPLKAHIIAVRPGHALNAELTKALLNLKNKKGKGKANPGPKTVLANETSLDIRRILDTLPHRYPFVMVDRVLEIGADDSIRAIKNVTINEPYFQGHFPGKPVMPGVLQVEAMAQAAGMLMLRRTNAENKVALFMSCDNVKFRKPVEPGDQLEIFGKLTKEKVTRGARIGIATCECKVNGVTVSSAEVMFTIMDANEA